MARGTDAEKGRPLLTRHSIHTSLLTSRYKKHSCQTVSAFPKDAASSSSALAAGRDADVRNKWTHPERQRRDTVWSHLLPDQHTDSLHFSQLKSPLSFFSPKRTLKTLCTGEQVDTFVRKTRSPGVGVLSERQSRGGGRARQVSSATLLPPRELIQLRLMQLKHTHTQRTAGSTRHPCASVTQGRVASFSMCLESESGPKGLPVPYQGPEGERGDFRALQKKPSQNLPRESVLFLRRRCSDKTSSSVGRGHGRGRLQVLP